MSHSTSVPVPPTSERAWLDASKAMLALAEGLHELACVFVRTRGELPFGEYTTAGSGPLAPVVVHTVLGGTEVERRAEVDRIAAILGVRGAADYFSCADARLLNAVYLAERQWGPVTYRVVTRLDAPGDAGAAGLTVEVDWDAERRLLGSAAAVVAASPGARPAAVLAGAVVAAPQNVTGPVSAAASHTPGCGGGFPGRAGDLHAGVTHVLPAAPARAALP